MAAGLWGTIIAEELVYADAGYVNYGEEPVRYMRKTLKGHNKKIEQVVENILELRSGNNA